jgi:hypothetical protein
MGAAAEAAYVTAPMTNRVIRVDVTDTVARFEIPAAFGGMPCEWVMYGSDADIVFGTSAVTCVYNQKSSVGSEAITVHSSSGRRLKDGIARYWVMPSITTETTHFAVDCVASGSGSLEISISGGG